MSVEPPIAQAPPTREPLKPLAKLPMPSWVAALAVVTALAFALGIARLPGSIKLAVNAERATRLTARGQGQKAVPLLEPIVQAYPQAIDEKITLAEAYSSANRPFDANKILGEFEDTKVDEEQSARLDAISKQVGSLVAADVQQAGELLANGHPKQAIPRLESIVKNLPDENDPKLALADAYEQVKRPRDADNILRSLRENSLDKDESAYLNQVALRVKKDLQLEKEKKP